MEGGIGLWNGDRGGWGGAGRGLRSHSNAELVSHPDKMWII